ncbi:DAK2 domain-containing protein [Actinoplanes sp. NPDC048796]|uniref:DAK2 domain-containing protein n=1 Tax=Actinoplanes sp. NPDC048796 TaxID=3155640 RepID=UPI0033D65B35
MSLRSAVLRPGDLVQLVAPSGWIRPEQARRVMETLATASRPTPGRRPPARRRRLRRKARGRLRLAGRPGVRGRGGQGRRRRHPEVRARLGRSSYLGDRVLGHPDPGAVAVWHWLTAVAATLRQ